MPTKNILLNSLLETFAIIWKRKFLFIFLLILQIAFFISFSLASYKYVPKMVESQKAIEDYMGQLKLDEDSVTSSILEKKGVLGDDPLSISRNFKEIVKNFMLYLISIFIMLIVFTSISWAATFRLIYEKKFSSLTKTFFKIFVVLSFYLGLIFAFFFSLSSISFADAAVESSNLLAKYSIFLIASIFLIYFMFVSLSLLQRTDLKNIVQNSLRIGIKKGHYVLSVYFINLSLLAISVISLVYFLEKNSTVLLLSFFILVFSFVFGRIFLVNAVERLG